MVVDGKASEAAEDSADAENIVEVRVICDPKSYLYLNGTTVDFETSDGSWVRLQQPQRQRHLRLRILILRLNQPKSA